MQLTREDWVRAGLNKLAQSGIQAVRIEVLARDLNISKGSFYHHFTNREELLESMIVYWEDYATKKIIENLEHGKSAVKRLIRLLDISFTGDNKLESAFYAWSKLDLTIANRLSQIEKQRTSYIAKLYQEMGLSISEADTQAEITYLMYLGWVDRLNRFPDLEKKYSDIKRAIIRLLEV